MWIPGERSVLTVDGVGVGRADAEAMRRPPSGARSQRLKVHTGNLIFLRPPFLGWELFKRERENETPAQWKREAFGRRGAEKYKRPASRPHHTTHGVHRRRRGGERWGCGSGRWGGGLAGAGRLGSHGASRRRRIGAKVMSWWRRKVVFPVKRAWLAVSSRVRSRKHGGGILKLYDDVQMCGYQDVQVMWEILTRSEMETSSMPKQRKRSSWRLSSWYSRSGPIETYE